MKIRSVTTNNRKRAFEVRTGRLSYSFPYAMAEIAPGSGERIAEVFVDPELGEEGFTYVLDSGREGSVHIDAVLEYNRDPGHMAELMLYELTLEAGRRVDDSPLSKRELMRRLKTSPAQFYRLLDPTYYRKSLRQMVALLDALGCDIELRVKPRRRTGSAPRPSRRGRRASGGPAPSSRGRGR